MKTCLIFTHNETAELIGFYAAIFFNLHKICIGEMEQFENGAKPINLCQNKFISSMKKR